MANPPVIGYFWDYENVPLTQEYQNGVSYVQRLRNRFGSHHCEKEFFAAFDTLNDMKDGWNRKIPDELSRTIQVLHVSNKDKNAADRILISRMRKFAEQYGNTKDCVVVLVTGDKDFGDIVLRYHTEWHIKVILIHNGHCSPVLLSQIPVPDQYNFYDLVKDVKPSLGLKDPDFVTVGIYLKPLNPQTVSTGSDEQLQQKLKEIFRKARHVFVDTQAHKASLQFVHISDTVDYFGFKGDVLGNQINLHFPECHDWRVKGQCALEAHCPKAHVPESKGIKVIQPSFDEWVESLAPTQLKRETSQPPLTGSTLVPVATVPPSNAWVKVASRNAGSREGSRSCSVEPHRLIERINNIGYENPNVTNSKILFVGKLGPNGKSMEEIGKGYKGAFSWDLTWTQYGEHLFFLNLINSELAEAALNDLEKRTDELIDKGIFLSNPLTSVQYNRTKSIEERRRPSDLKPKPNQIFVSNLVSGVNEAQLKEIGRKLLSACDFTGVFLKKGKKENSKILIALDFAFFNFGSISGTAKAKALLIELYDKDIKLWEPKLFTVASVIN